MLVDQRPDSQLPPAQSNFKQFFSLSGENVCSCAKLAKKHATFHLACVICIQQIDQA